MTVIPRDSLDFEEFDVKPVVEGTRVASPTSTTPTSPNETEDLSDLRHECSNFDSFQAQFRKQNEEIINLKNEKQELFLEKMKKEQCLILKDRKLRTLEGKVAEISQENETVKAENSSLKQENESLKMFLKSFVDKAGTFLNSNDDSNEVKLVNCNETFIPPKPPVLERQD